MSAFKTYVIKEIYNGAVFERRIQMALEEELEQERNGALPDLSKAVTDDQLVKMVEGSKSLHMILTQFAQNCDGILTPEDAKILRDAGITGAALYQAPKSGTLDKPALLNENPAPDVIRPTSREVTLQGEATA